MLLSELGVQPAKEKQFNKKGIFTAEDLVRFLPRKYNDLTQITGIQPPDRLSCLIVTVKEIKTNHASRVPYVMATCEIEGDIYPLQVFWFRQVYMVHHLGGLIGRKVFAAGRVTKNLQYKNYTMSSPEKFIPYNGPQDLTVNPIYPKIGGMSADYLTGKIHEAMRFDSVVGEIFPREIVAQYSDLSLLQAIRNLHMPQTMQEVEEGQKRLLCDELLNFAAANEWNKRNSAVGSPFSIKTLKLYHDIVNALPYQLTDDQASAVKTMLAHVQEGKRINALVQGDVGCGKTIIAILMVAAFAGSGYQTAIMAPTQVLARQHYEDVVSIMEPHGIKVAYLGTDVKAAEKKKIAKGIGDGSIKVVVGTQSVFGKTITYNNLALTVADEEHKFGVAQRNALIEKASAGVHAITMSATPIPRSLAQVIYGGNTQLYTIKTMPAGRKPVITGLATTKEKLFNFIIKEAKAGHQTYVVCPMIDANEDMEGVRSVEEVSKEFLARLAPHGIQIETLTGRDSKDKKKTEEIINRFKDGTASVLISTTVIEVGVNVPTATTMVIINAERFGLAALHQLRGRVGRGSYQSFCVLDAEHAGEEGRERLAILVNNSSGFEIAKEDLRLRGAGDFIGTRQSGDNKYLSLLLAYPNEYKKAQELAVELIDKYGWTPN